MKKVWLFFSFFCVLLCICQNDNCDPLLKKIWRSSCALTEVALLRRLQDKGDIERFEFKFSKQFLNSRTFFFFFFAFNIISRFIEIRIVRINDWPRVKNFNPPKSLYVFKSIIQKSLWYEIFIERKQIVEKSNSSVVSWIH